MAYQPSKPDFFIAKSIAQGDILGNFQAYEAAWQYDHTDLDSANNGWHNKVSLTPTDEIPELISSDIALYATAPQNQTQTGYLAVKRGSPVEEYTVRSYIAQNQQQSAWRTFSGLLVKQYVRRSINTNGGDVILNITQAVLGNVPIFTDIYTILPTVLNDNNGTDSNADVLVTGWSLTPTVETINLRIWRRNLNGTEGTDHPPVLINLLMIGKG